MSLWPSAIVFGVSFLYYTAGRQEVAPAYAIILTLVLVLAIYRMLLRDAWQGAVVQNSKTLGELWLSIKASGGARIGLRIFRAFVGAIGLLAFSKF